MSDGDNLHSITHLTIYDSERESAKKETARSL